jgi:hypothetical protein
VLVEIAAERDDLLGDNPAQAGKQREREQHDG